MSEESPHLYFLKIKGADLSISKLKNTSLGITDIWFVTLKVSFST
jgi:hypothetical protein